MCEYCENIPEKGNEDESPCISRNGNKYYWYFHGLYEEHYEISFCPMCGRKLTETKDNAETKRIIHAHAIVDWLGNLKCSNCGSINIDVTEPYCQHCGADLDEPIERRD